MRALFTCYPLFGHFLPLTPIARAMAEALTVGGRPATLVHDARD